MRAPPSPTVLVLLLVLLLVLTGCPEAPPLAVELSSATVEADGRARVRVTVRAKDAINGATAQVTATGGALTTSSVLMVDGVAIVELIAPLEKELGRRAQRPIDVAAAVVLGADERLDASAGLVALPPADGPPILFVDAAPAAAVAGSGGEVAISIQARRVPAGARLGVSAAGAAVIDAEAVVDDTGAASARVRVPDAPVDALVTVREPGGVEGTVVVRFVADGEPLFDLTGAWVQLGPARVKLDSTLLAPNPQCAMAPSIILAEFLQTGLDVDGSYTTCEVTFPPVTSIVGTVTNRATPAFYDAIPPVLQTFALPTGDLGAHYEPGQSVVVVGAVLDDPETDALPTAEDDERVTDDDGDGEPGVTVENSIGGAQHIVFRNIARSQGSVASSNRIVGAAKGDLLAAAETSVFGLGGAFLPATSALGSVIELVRIDGRFGAADADVDGDGVISCAEVIDIAGSVGELEPPDTPFDCGDEK